MSNVSFSTCSFMRSASSVRAGMARSAFNSWKDLLLYPFHERIFLDDHSPDFASSRVLASASVLGLFDRIEYQPITHAPHCNIGTLGCLRLATTPLVLHIDDDIFVQCSPEVCHAFIDEALTLMENDSSIKGCNLLNLGERHAEEWLGDEPYAAHPTWKHPKKFFGTGACLLRRDLLERVTFEQVLAWGDKQPDMWEVLVTNSPKEFLVAPTPTPFASEISAFYYSSTEERSLAQRMTYEAKRAVKQFLPDSVMRTYHRARGTPTPSRQPGKSY